MRRNDREILDGESIKSIISDCHCLRLGLYDEGEVYIVPLNFGYAEQDGKISFYFHGAKEGRKIDLISKTHRAGFEMDANYALNEGESACEYSARFRSVIGIGRVEFIEDAAEKEAALQAIMHQSTSKSGWSFSDAMLASVCVFKLEVEKISCKEHL